MINHCRAKNEQLITFCTLDDRKAYSDMKQTLVALTLLAFVTAQAQTLLKVNGEKDKQVALQELSNCAD